MKHAKYIQSLLIVFLFGSAFTILLSCDNNSNHTQPESIESLELNNATIYGTLRLTEKIDGGRSGMTVHDLHIKVDYMQDDSAMKSYIEKAFYPSSYETLTWNVLKKNVLDQADNYVGLSDISQSFKTKVLDSKIKISGRVYKHCMNKYYLNPIEEKEPKEPLSCWAATEQHHIRLSGYSKK